MNKNIKYISLVLIGLNVLLSATAYSMNDQPELTPSFCSNFDFQNVPVFKRLAAVKKICTGNPKAAFIGATGTIGGALLYNGSLKAKRVAQIGVSCLVCALAVLGIKKAYDDNIIGFNDYTKDPTVQASAVGGVSAALLGYIAYHGYAYFISKQYHALHKKHKISN